VNLIKALSSNSKNSPLIAPLNIKISDSVWNGWFIYIPSIIINVWLIGLFSFINGTVSDFHSGVKTFVLPYSNDKQGNITLPH
jgi:hypothetical protein